MGGGSSQILGEIRLRKIAERDQQIKKGLQIFSKILKDQNINEQKIEKITRLSLQQLINQLNEYKVTSKQLVAIYGYRSATIGLKLGLITETNFENAVKLAQACDDYRRSSKKRNWAFKNKQQNQNEFLPPLYGLPISIKDTFDMQGLSSSVGITKRALDLKKQDCFLVKALKQAGLIPFVKSNVPQLAMIFDSYNYLWGRAKNPWNQLRGVGGSSGGQGGLIAARCSPIGVGSDIGGSIRIPAEFCGVYGLKSSDSRLSNSYSTDYCLSFSGIDTLKVITGPLSNSVDGLALWLKVVSDQEHYKGNHDPYNKLIPFNTKVYQEYQTKKKLKIGYFKSLNFIESTPASQRAVQQTITLLKSLGHQVKQIQIPNQKYVIRSFYSEFAAEGNSLTFKCMLDKQQFIPEYNQINTLAGLNSMVYWIVNAIFNRTAPRLGFLLSGSAKKTVHQYLTHVGQVQQYKKEFINFWRKENLDYIICPGFGSQACLHGYSERASIVAAYTFIWNVLGMTVGAMPVTLCKKEEENYVSAHTDEVTDKLKQTAVDTEGLPVGIQVVGLPFQDEKVLGLMKSLQKSIQFYRKNPLPNC